MKALAVALVVAIALLLPASAAAQAPETGWRITSFQSDITIEADGDVRFVEAVDVDFGTLQRHGIFRDIITRQPCGTAADGPAPLFPCPGGSDRRYPITVESVTDADGKAHRFERSTEGQATRLKIGDPDRTISGTQTYRIRYTLRGALNAFEGSDEFFWNVTGHGWTVPLARVVVNVTLPAGAEPVEACAAGRNASIGGPVSSVACRTSVQGSTATYRTTRPIYPGEEVTVVAGWPKGIVAVQPPVLEDRVSVDDFFTFDAVEFGGMAGFGLLAFGTLARFWWLNGRDRRYRSVYYLTDDPDEGTAPLFKKLDIVVEFLPPEGLRPAQMGVLVDERADTLDVTATIVDLAVRGYLTISELEKSGWFGKTDWRLEKATPEGAEDLLPYERRLYSALFRNREKVTVSALKTAFYKQLAEVKSDLYDDALKRKWFARNPETSRGVWAGVAVGWILVAIGLSVAAGIVLERALMPVPLVVAGILMLPLSRAMARRTATGSEALRRTLGFKLYITTAETRRQEFNEQQNIFARYLPYAIVFECVDKWGEAFEGLDEQVQSSTISWYHGLAAFQVGAFTAGLGSFANSVSTSITSTPGGSGGSGFSGGSSGGGGGGGGGGSW